MAVYDAVVAFTRRSLSPNIFFMCPGMAACDTSNPFCCKVYSHS